MQAIAGPESAFDAALFLMHSSHLYAAMNAKTEFARSMNAKAEHQNMNAKTEFARSMNAKAEHQNMNAKTERQKT